MVLVILNQLYFLNLTLVVLVHCQAFVRLGHVTCHGLFVCILKKEQLRKWWREFMNSYPQIQLKQYKEATTTFHVV